MSYWALMVYRTFVLELLIGGTLGLTMVYKTIYKIILKLFNCGNLYQRYYLCDIEDIFYYSRLK